MNFYKLLNDSKKSVESKSEIIKSFEPKIKNVLPYTHSTRYEDLKQELNVKILEIIDSYDVEQISDLEEYLQFNHSLTIDDLSDGGD